jgi:hypothetical protein
MRGHLPSFDVEVIKRNKKIWLIIVRHRRNLAFDWARSHGESWWVVEGFVRLERAAPPSVQLPLGYTVETEGFPLPWKGSGRRG